MAAPYIENYIPAVRLAKGINTKKNITVGGSANFDMSGSTGTFKTPTGATTLSGSVTVPTGKTLTVTDTAALSIGGAIVPTLEYVTSQSFAAATFANGQYPIYTFPNDGFTWKVAFASLRFSTASSSGTVDVQFAASGTALSSGTTVLNGTMSTAGTANTAVNATMAASPPTIAGGAALLLVSGGTVTGLVNLVVTVALQRLG